jgi:hypothetical protein
MKSLASQEIYKANGCVNHLALIISLLLKSQVSYVFSVSWGVAIPSGILIKRLNISHQDILSGGCSHSQIAIAALQIMALSSPEKRIPKIVFNSVQVNICGPRN